MKKTRLLIRMPLNDIKFYFVFRLKTLKEINLIVKIRCTISALDSCVFHKIKLWNSWKLTPLSEQENLNIKNAIKDFLSLKAHMQIMFSHPRYLFFCVSAIQRKREVKAEWQNVLSSPLAIVPLF